MSTPIPVESRVAVLVDCDNVPAEILEHALLMAAQFGRVVVRRGYGNQVTLANKWQDALVRQAFTPCLQYQYAPERTRPTSRWLWTRWKRCSISVPTPSVL